MSLASVAVNLGKIGQVAFEGYTLDVKILDARPSFGRIDYMVEPVSGSGTLWISSERLTVKAETTNNV
jgi:hypothetical protein